MIRAYFRTLMDNWDFWEAEALDSRFVNRPPEWVELHTVVEWQR